MRGSVGGYELQHMGCNSRFDWRSMGLMGCGPPSSSSAHCMGPKETEGRDKPLDMEQSVDSFVDCKKCTEDGGSSDCLVETGCVLSLDGMRLADWNSGSYWAGCCRLREGRDLSRFRQG